MVRDTYRKTNEVIEDDERRWDVICTLTDGTRIAAPKVELRVLPGGAIYELETGSGDFIRIPSFMCVAVRSARAQQPVVPVTAAPSIDVAF